MSYNCSGVGQLWSPMCSQPTVTPGGIGKYSSDCIRPASSNTICSTDSHNSFPQLLFPRNSSMSFHHTSTICRYELFYFLRHSISPLSTLHSALPRLHVLINISSTVILFLFSYLFAAAVHCQTYPSTSLELQLQQDFQPARIFIVVIFCYSPTTNPPLPSNITNCGENYPTVILQCHHLIQNLKREQMGWPSKGSKLTFAPM